MSGWGSLDCSRDCVNACVQCIHLEYVADLYIYMCLHFFRIVIVHITQYLHAIDTAFYM